ncbi:MAG: hypothetical protein U0790_22800 [Isosphaeraceae bacterium]
MIIQCPKCGFSGRIPDYAIAGPHNARCPQCRYRFELGSYLADLSADDGGLRSLGELNGAGRNGHGDPASSSYELKAISDDFQGVTATMEPDDFPDPDWDDLEGTDASATSRPLAKGPRAAVRSEEALSDDDPEPEADEFPLAFAGTSDPWYSRVLQVWGVVFLAWAGMLLVRSLYLMASNLTDKPGDADVIPTVVAVLLLVPGAAGLFLLVDLGRYIRSLRTATVRTTAPAPARTGPLATPARRAWLPRRASIRLQSS